MSRLPTLVAYDITDDSARAKAFRTVLEWRLDGQKSVHECRLNRAEAEEIFVRLSELIDPVGDRIMLARIEDRLVRTVGRKPASRSLAPGWLGIR